MKQVFPWEQETFFYPDRMQRKTLFYLGMLATQTKITFNMNMSVSDLTCNQAFLFFTAVKNAWSQVISESRNS